MDIAPNELQHRSRSSQLLDQNHNGNQRSRRADLRDLNIVEVEVQAGKADGSPPPLVLVIDDDAQVLCILDELLEDEGYWVTTSTHVLDVEQIRQLSPDLILLDIVFNGEYAGLGFLTSIREHSDLSAIPVIVCTAASYLLKSDGFSCPETNVEIIEKPFNINDMLAAIQRCLAPVPNRPTSESLLKQ